MTLTRRRLVRVPASSANLGPGFDVLAAALALHLEVEVVETGGFAVHTDLEIRRDRQNLVVQAFERLHPADGFEFTIRSEIPLSGGLGSSAAAIVGGLMAADHMFELDADVLALAAEIEGHPDNVAAAMHGGVVICCGAVGRSGPVGGGGLSGGGLGGGAVGRGGAGGDGVTRLEPPLGLEAILVVPAEPVQTAAARAVLPATVSLADASANIAAAARLTVGLATGDLELVAAGLQDRLHQPYRAHLYPRSAELVEQAPKLGALGATISGAGPTVLVWTQVEHTGTVVEGLRRLTAGWAAVVRAPFESQGAYVRGL
jgi:homoserine kinase